MDQFQAHLEEIRSGGHGVLPLPEILERMRNAVDIPDRTVAITVDDAYASVYARAWPLLREAGLPFTLFVSTDSVDCGSPGYMTWDQIRELKAAGVTIGSRTASHPHLHDIAQAQVTIELDRAAQRIAEETAERTTRFA